MRRDPTMRALSARALRAGALAGVLAVLASVLGGCVSRKLFIQSEPPGATVVLDGRVIGTTPWEGDFGSYGVRGIELEKPGYARRFDTFEIPLPWWQYPVFDVVTDLMLPWTIDEHYSFSWELKAIDPEAGTWEEARAAQESMDMLR